MLFRKKHRGFTLVELVITLAILGILMLMLMPQYQTVTQAARLRTFEYNCRAVASAIAVYQAGHDGDLPAAATDLAPYLNGGWAKLDGNPAGATYRWTSGGLRATYVDDEGNTHSFTYPD